MATMLNGAAVMDAALLLIAANEPCPQPQTSEHLAAIEIMKLEHILVLQVRRPLLPSALVLTHAPPQNKVDLIREQQADEHHQSILTFVKGTVADSAPIIPISAQLRYNIDALVEYIVTKIPVPIRDFQTSPKLIVIRSFDVNKPGAEVHELKGGVAGGSLLKGVLRVRSFCSVVREGELMRVPSSWARRLRCDREWCRRIPRARSTAGPFGARSSRSWPRRTSSSLLCLEDSLESERVRYSLRSGRMELMPFRARSYRPPAYAWRSSCRTSARIKGITPFDLHRD